MIDLPFGIGKPTFAPLAHWLMCANFSSKQRYQLKTIQTTTIELSLEDIKAALLKVYSPNGGQVAFELEDVSRGEDRYPSYKLASAKIKLTTEK